jgi:hypothetical protein
MIPTPVFDSYWRFAAERQAILERRLRGEPPPWTDDPILRRYRFTNAYRVADRVSQYLIAEVQERQDRSQEPRELFFRTLLFRCFNRIETWEALEAATGPLAWRNCDLDRLAAALERLKAGGCTLYSAAYVIPPPPFGHGAKHRNQLALIAAAMAARMAERLAQAPSLEEVFYRLRQLSGLGSFLAFQLAIDLNYSSLIDFPESEFVVAGPGALDGIAKCFSGRGGRSPEEVIRWCAERQEEEFRRRGLAFRPLMGRPLQLIDCQNLFCEIAKYARVAHPDVMGASGRTRIKQTYRPTGGALPPLRLPAKWHGNRDLTVG